MYSIGLDLSLSCTGVVVLGPDEDMVLAATIKTKTAKGCEGRTKRFQNITNQIVGIVREHMPCIVAVEGCSFGSGMRRGPGGKMFQQAGTLDRSELRGIVYSSLVSLGVTFSEPSPKTVKVVLAGSGNASKEDMLNACVQRGIDFGSKHDLADAYGCALVALGGKNAKNKK